MIRINRGADLEDMWGGQVEFEVAVTMVDDGGLWDIIGAGHTVAEAVAEAREAFRGWRSCPVTCMRSCCSLPVSDISDRDDVELDQ